MRITIHVPDTLDEDLKRMAANQGLSVSSFAAKAKEAKIMNLKTPDSRS